MSLSTTAKLAIGVSIAFITIIFIVIVYFMFFAASPVATPSTAPAFVPSSSTPDTQPVIQPAPVVQPAKQTTYVGCYGDTTVRAMPILTMGPISLAQCKDLATKQGLSIFGLQYGSAATGLGVCTGGNSLSDAQRYGLAGNCAPISSTDVVGAQMGGAWSNAVYTV